MKIVIITVAASIVTMATFFAAATLTSNGTTILSSDQLGERVIAALKKSSFQDYKILYPTLEELQLVMNNNSELYGDYLEDAQSEFSKQYNHELIPALRNSFEALLRDGNAKGIEWNTVKYLGIESSSKINTQISSSNATILFSSGGKEYRLSIERIPVLNGQWRISQFTSLEPAKI